MPKVYPITHFLDFRETRTVDGVLPQTIPSLPFSILRHKFMSVHAACTLFIFSSELFHLYIFLETMNYRYNACHSSKRDQTSFLAQSSPFSAVLCCNLNKDGRGLNDLRVFTRHAQDMTCAWQTCGNSHLIGRYYIVSRDNRDVPFLSLCLKGEPWYSGYPPLQGDAFWAA